MKLDALPCRHPERAIGMTIGELIEGKILVRREPPAGNADADHELPHFVLAALLALGGGVAVITLVDPVKFEERIPFTVKRLRLIGEILRDPAAELAALLLDRLGLRDRLDWGYAHHLRDFRRQPPSAGQSVRREGVGGRWIANHQRAKDQGQ